MPPNPPAAAARPAGHALVEALLAQGVTHCFGVPGESYLAVLDGLHEHRSRIRFVTCRQEGGAAFMAEAQGKLTGRPGVCFVTRGPGATNASIGVHTAFQDSTPMVLFVGQVASDQRDREAFQELDYRQFFGPGTLGMAKWAAEVQSADRLPEYVARAFRTAMQGRPGPVVLALPENLLTTPTAAPVLPRVEPAEAWPAPGAMRSLRERLLAARRPFVLVGGPGWDASACASLERFAEHWALPVGNAFRFQDTFDNRHPNHAGDVGIGIAPKLGQRVREADLVLALGVRLGEMTTGGYTLLAAPRPAQALVHVHPGAEELGRVYAPDLAIQASMPAIARSLEALEPPRELPWGGLAREANADYEANLVHVAVEPMDLAVVMKALAARVPPSTVYTNGAGNYSGWLHRFVRHPGRRHHGRTQLAPTAGAMGYGLPAAVAAALIDPSRLAVNVTGDGDLMMTVQEMATARMHGASRLLCLVVDNGSYGTIRMHQEREYPDRVAGSDLANPDFAALAVAFGWHGDRVERTADFAPALERALAAIEGGRPAMLHLLLPTERITSRGTLADVRAAGERARAAGHGAPP
jgi:acetolactate synthase-1/2/3 large subunit